MRRNYKGISINTSKNTHEKVLSLINKDSNSVVVDIPCGAGAFIKRLTDHGYKNVIGIDVENMLEIDHEDFRIGDMTKKLPVPDNSCDVVVCIDGIEHIGSQFDFVAEINRILKDNGEYIISTPNISSLRSRWKWLFTGHHHKCSSPLDEINPTPLHHIGMISFPEIRYLLHTKGFNLVKVITNRIKLIGALYFPIVPFVFISTLWIYWRTGHKEKTWPINKEVFKIMFTKEVLFGESLIIKAIKFSS